MYHHMTSHDPGEGDPVPSDTLLTVDLKSGSKIKIGTHTITLDKFFEGNLKTTRWLDIGNC